MSPENMYLIDGFDLWRTFGITIEKGGLDDLLKLPKRKQSIQHNWQDENGLDVDLSRTFLEAKDSVLKCIIIADNETDFWLHYNQFLSLLIKPGTRRFTVNVFNMNYYIYYKDCTIYQKLTAFKQTGKLICKFNLTISETVPGFQNIPTFLTDESNNFIIT